MSSFVNAHVMYVKIVRSMSNRFGVIEKNQEKSQGLTLKMKDKDN